MPAKPGKEQSLLKRFISVYEGGTLAAANCDWVDEREDGAVEVEHLRGDFSQLDAVDEIWIAETHDNRPVVLFESTQPDGSYDPEFAFVGEELIWCQDD